MFVPLFQINVQLIGQMHAPGDYAIVVEYASEEETAQIFTVTVNSPGERTHQERITLAHCKYRSVSKCTSLVCPCYVK